MGSASDMTDEEYAREYGIEALLDEMRQQLLARKPKGPLPFLATYIDHRIVQTRDQYRRSNNTDIFSFWKPRRMSEEHKDPDVNSSTVHALQTIQRQRGNSRLALGMDIGGSLTKVVFYEAKDTSYLKESEYVKRSLRYGSTGVREPHLSFSWKEGKFHFFNFETRRMEGALDLLMQERLLRDDRVILATGGGAQKYGPRIQEKLGCDLLKGDELACLLVGVNFVLHHVPAECYYLKDHTQPLQSPKVPVDMTNQGVFPYLLVNIGSGVSVLMVNDERSFERVSGSTIGGGTYFGLCKLLTQCQTFGDALKMAEEGDYRNVDMLVRDIYGSDYKAFNLSAGTVASSFGKAGMMDDVCKPQDIAASLLRMIGINIAQLAYLCAMRHDVTRVIFAGSFLRDNRISMGGLSFSINYWSQDIIQALFLQHEGYCGAIGAFLLQDASLFSSLAIHSDE